MSQSALITQYSDEAIAEVDSQLSDLPAPGSLPLQARKMLLSSSQTAIIKSIKPKNGEVKVYELLNAALEHCPSIEGKDWLARRVLASQGDQDNLNKTAQYFYSEVLYPLKALGGVTPPISPHDSPFVLPDDLQSQTEQVDLASRNGQQILKHELLRRDGFKCCLSGYGDMNSFMDHLLREEDVDHVGYTDAAHILPFSLNQFDGTQPEKGARYAVTWEILSLWAPSLDININGLICDRINGEHNAMTLRRELHRTFGKFDICLEHLVDNHYKIRGWGFFEGPKLRSGRTQVEFKNHDPSNHHDLPNQHALALHAALAHVMHACGAAKAIDHALRDEEVIGVLASDGSTDVFSTLTAHLSVAMKPLPRGGYMGTA